MTQTLYQKAISYAGEKHSNQKVPGTSSNYIVHISNVAMEVIMAHKANPDFDLDLAVQVALLHDTIEDTSATHAELVQEFGQTIADGALALTKDKTLGSKEEKMADSLNRITVLAKEIAIVKLADRITNLQHPPSHWDDNKIAYYLQEAKKIQATLSFSNEYLSKRILQKIEAYKKHIV